MSMSIALRVMAVAYVIGCALGALLAPVAAPVATPAPAPVAATPAPAPAGLPACPAEDSPGPCHWNATTRGNGRGRSFVVDAQQRVTYLPAPEATPASATPATPVVARKQARHESRMVDCEDMDVQPCVTLDEGRWRMVWSYRPYASTPVHACKPSHLVRPCLVTRPTTEGTYRWLW